MHTKPERVAWGERAGAARLTVEQVQELRRRYRKGCPVNGTKPLAREYGLAPSTVYDVVRRRSWAHV